VLDSSSVKVLGSPEAEVQLMVADPPEDHVLSFGVLSVKADTRGKARARVASLLNIIRSGCSECK